VNNLRAEGRICSHFDIPAALKRKAGSRMKVKRFVVALCLIVTGLAQAQPKEPLGIDGEKPLTVAGLKEYFGAALKRDDTLRSRSRTSLLERDLKCEFWWVEDISFLLNFDYVIYQERWDGTIGVSRFVTAGDCNKVAHDFFALTHKLNLSAAPLPAAVAGNEIVVDLKSIGPMLESNKVALAMENGECQFGYEFIRRK
jgi:hypothetical protein